MRKQIRTRGSWEKASQWYGKTVAEKGHYYHEHVVLPGVLKLLRLQPHDSVIDLAAGNGVLARQLPTSVRYTGVEISPSLVTQARKLNRRPGAEFLEADVTIVKQYVAPHTHGVIILAIQNIAKPELALKNLAANLKDDGVGVIVMNHPCFRIPRQSSWEIDPRSKIQYRRINRYLSPLEIPITIHPGQEDSPTTWDFHFSLSDWSNMLYTAGFVIEQLEEWTSDKESAGKAAKMENRARQEFPLFLAWRLRKSRI